MLTDDIHSCYLTSNIYIHNLTNLDHNTNPQSEFHSQLYEDGRELRIYTSNSDSDIKIAMLFPDGAKKERLIDGSLRICFVNQGKNCNFTYMSNL